MDTLQSEAGEKPLYRYVEDDTARVLLPWSWYGDQQSLKASLAESIEKERADGAEALIQACCGRSWEMTTGIPQVGDVRRDVYRTIERFVDPELIMEVLKERYSPMVGSSEFNGDRDVPVGERVARQFAFVHLHPPKDEKSRDDDTD